MYRPYMCCLLLLLAVLAGNAQLKNRRALKADTGRVYLRFSPLGAIDPWDGNVTFGGEYRFNDTWSATLDAGAILYSAYFSHSKQATGLLFRPGIRVYPTEYKDFFIDLQFHYKTVTYKIHDWLQKDVVNNVATYEEYQVFKYKKKVIGGHAMVGYRDYFTSNRRFYIEVYAGIGIHYKDEGLYKEPNSRYDMGFRINNTSNGTYTLPALPMGFRLVYLIR